MSSTYMWIQWLEHDDEDDDHLIASTDIDYDAFSELLELLADLHLDADSKVYALRNTFMEKFRAKSADSRLPLKWGTKVLTRTAPTKLAPQWRDELQAVKRVNAAGIVVDTRTMAGGPTYYVVMHKDGARVDYDPSELLVLK